MNIDYLKNKNIHFIECEDWNNAYGYEKTQMKEDTINYIEQLQQENKQLKMINQEYERLKKQKSRGFKIINVEEYDIHELLSYKDKWNKLKKFLKNTIEENLKYDKKHNCEWQGYNVYLELLTKIQELEKGSDSNVKD